MMRIPVIGTIVVVAVLIAAGLAFGQTPGPGEILLKCTWASSSMFDSRVKGSFRQLTTPDDIDYFYLNEQREIVARKPNGEGRTYGESEKRWEDQSIYLVDVHRPDTPDTQTEVLYFNRTTGSVRMQHTREPLTFIREGTCQKVEREERKF